MWLGIGTGDGSGRGARVAPPLHCHGDLQIVERLHPVAEDEAPVFHRAFARRTPAVADPVDVVHRVHGQAHLRYGAARLSSRPPRRTAT